MSMVHGNRSTFHMFGLSTDDGLGGGAVEMTCSIAEGESVVDKAHVNLG